jgi:hypothetical protein
MTPKLILYLAHDMRTLFRIIVSLSVVTAGCCGCTNCGSCDRNLPPIISQAGRRMVPPFAYNQLLAGQRSVIGQTKHPVFSIAAGLPDMRRRLRIPSSLLQSRMAGSFTPRRLLGTESPISQCSLFRVSLLNAVAGRSSIGARGELNRSPSGSARFTSLPMIMGKPSLFFANRPY